MNMLAADGEERTRLMLDFSVGFDGRQYLACGYRYDRLEDAVNYARLMQTRRRRAGALPMAPVACEDLPAVVPDAAECELMGKLGITRVGLRYEFSGYRYDRLADAINYAQRPSQTRRGVS